MGRHLDRITAAGTPRHGRRLVLVAVAATVVLVGGVPLAAPLLRADGGADGSKQGAGGTGLPGPTGTTPDGSPVTGTTTTEATGASTGSPTGSPTLTTTTTARTTTTTTTWRARTRTTTTKASPRPPSDESPPTKRKPKPKPPPGTPPDPKEVLSLTNAERAEAGCGALTWNSTLARVAAAHSADMADRDYFSHDSLDGRDPFERIRDAGYSYRSAAENIAAGQPTAEAVVDGWMNSPGHRANILNCGLKQLGVGVALGGSYGIYWTQAFATPS